jgi:uncharacterized membrane protein YdjX (TVP38/TMEM64 family)
MALTPRRRLIALALLVGCLVALCALFAPHSTGALRATAAGFGWAAPLAFVAVWIVLTPGLVSGTLLAAASGLLFGAAGGTLVAIVGATLGGLAAFAIARRVGHDAMTQVGGARLRRVQERLADRGFFAVLSLRAAPGVPATWLNYAAGLSRIRARDFAAGSALGGAPRIFAYAALGGSFGHFGSPTAIAAAAVLAVMTVVGAYSAWLTGRSLRSAA